MDDLNEPSLSPSKSDFFASKPIPNFSDFLGNEDSSIGDDKLRPQQSFSQPNSIWKHD